MLASEYLILIKNKINETFENVKIEIDDPEKDITYISDELSQISVDAVVNKFIERIDYIPNYISLRIEIVDNMYGVGFTCEK